MASLLSLLKCLYQSDVRSKLHRENYQRLENKCNELQTQYDAGLVPPGGSEVSNARDYAPVLRERLRSMSRAIGTNLLLSGGVVSANGGTMKVDVSAGEALVDGYGNNWTDSTSELIPVVSTAGHARLDVVVVNSDNTISIVPGTSAVAASAKPNAITTSQKALGIVLVSYGMTSIVAGDIYQIIGGGIKVGSTIWIVEPFKDVEIRVDAAYDADLDVRLLPSMNAGDRVRVVNNRDQSANVLMRPVVVKCLESGSWVEITTIWEGGASVVASKNNPLVVLDYTVENRCNRILFFKAYGVGGSYTTPNRLGISTNDSGDMSLTTPRAGFNDPVYGTSGQWKAPRAGKIRAEYFVKTSEAQSVFLSLNNATYPSWQMTRSSTTDGSFYYSHGCFEIDVARGDTIDLRMLSSGSAWTARAVINYLD